MTSGQQEGKRLADDEYDIVVVGARCAGSSLATHLARGGWRVALVDADRFPSDTVSTHVMFPDSLQQLDRLGVLDRLQADHQLAPVRFSWRVLGREVAGSFTPVDGRDRCLSVRRVSLDAALVAVAVEAGAVLHSPRRVVGVVGSGTPEDPARGVLLDDGHRLLARWVVGADGRRSTVANRLGLPVSAERRGEMSFLLAYWGGMPRSDWCVLDNHERSALMSVPVEDGLHLLSVAGPPDLTRGSAVELTTRYEEALRRFPAVLNPRLLDQARRVTPVVGAPETMMRGYTRPAVGPGWVLVGDAGGVTHPVAAQGIGDALHQAAHVAADLLAGGDLRGFGAWRDARTAGHAEWSFRAARFPGPRDAGLYAGIAADSAARQAFLDMFTQRSRITDVVTPERSARWRAAAAYEDGLHRLRGLLGGLSPGQSSAIVPACPEWTVRDLLAHLAGVAEDAVAGAFFSGALDAWRDDRVAAEREEWTAGQVAARRDDDAAVLLAALQHHGDALVRALRSGDGPAAQAPTWLVASPAADLSVHLEDLAEAVGAPALTDTLAVREGFVSYRWWLSSRLDSRSLPGLRLVAGEQSWTLGTGEPVATVAADRYELFRMITGRRTADQIRSLRWDGDPTPFLDVIAPYPLPA